MVLWDVTPYSFVDKYQCFKGACCWYLQGKRSVVKTGNKLPQYAVSHTRIPHLPHYPFAVLLLYIWQGPCSDLGLEVGCPDNIFVFISVPPGKHQDGTQTV